MSQALPGAERRDIEGLRAIAVLLVLFYHADLPGFGGGFVGVDIFFVISGFLTTGLLLRDPAPRFLPFLLSFYRRRFWRIAPAAWLTILLTLPAAGLLFLPGDLVRAAWSAVWALLFASNLLFAGEAGYFDAASTVKPLLHTWSLAVEIQFYLVWPFVIWAMRRGRGWAGLWLMLGLVAASFVGSAILSVTDFKVAFFSLASRLWEFGFGALAALRAPGGARQRRHWGDWAGVLALAVLAATHLYVDDDDLWPLPWALPAVLATTVLLAGDPRSRVGRFLSLPPLHAIGHRSYALYLVHWPMLVFVGYAAFPQASLPARIAVLAGSFLAAEILHRFVEVPLRRQARRPAPSRLALAAVALMAAATLALGGVAVWRHGDVGLWPRPVLALVRDLDAVCPPPLREDAGGGCSAPSGQAPRVMLWGDSHAGQYAFELEARLAERGISAAAIVRDGCPPLLGVRKVSTTLRFPAACEVAAQHTLDAILAQPAVETVVLVARWPLYAETTRFGTELASRAYLVDATRHTLDAETSRAVLGEGLDRTIEALQAGGKRVVLIGPSPEMPTDAGRCGVMRLARSRSTGICDAERPEVDARRRAALDILREEARRRDVPLLDPVASLCDARLCPAVAGGRVLYRDGNHLSGVGAAKVLAGMVDPIVATLRR